MSKQELENIEKKLSKIYTADNIPEMILPLAKTLHE